MSGTTANLNDEDYSFEAGNDGIVVVKLLEDIPGGKTLDTTGYTEKTIREGHLVIEETATGVLKPMPVTTAGAYDALPADHTYKGVVIASVRTSKPFVSILVRGRVNYIAAPFGITPILAAVQGALPLINFIKD